jgi:23S rRNA (cytosine1962-C5)-methyltransferase
VSPKRALEVSTAVISSRAAKRLRAGHPWVYRTDLPDAHKKTPRAALVRVEDERGRFLGSALSSSSSQIALRLISTEQVPDDAALLALINKRIDQALAYRKRFVQDSTASRLVFSEADSLPGLIVDQYNDVLTMQVLTQAMDREDIRDTVRGTLLTALGKSISIVERVEPRIRELEELPLRESGFLAGKRSSTEFQMNGLRFQFDALGGQKTGAFLDQRENYAAAAKYAFGDAMDVFTYQGGFALHLARVCRSLTGVDQSRAALEVADQNAALNQSQFTCGEIEWLEADAFELLKDYSSSGKQFDTIVLDPPAFAKSKRAFEGALRGYKEINLRALKMLRPGGILVTCSCSFHVSESDFSEMLASAAGDAGRRVRILEKRGQSKDHPQIASIPETHYLKCLICAVD